MVQQSSTTTIVSSSWLEMPDGGFYIDPVFARTTYDSDICEALTTLLDDPSGSPQPTAPGVGLPGILFCECRQYDQKSHRCNWRDLQVTSNNPDEVPDSRLSLLSRVFGKATAFSFNIYNLRGLVIYYARRQTSESTLNSSISLLFMKNSAMMIGSLVSWGLSRENVQLEAGIRSATVRDKFRKAVKKVIKMNAINKSFQSISHSLDNNIDRRDNEGRHGTYYLIREIMVQCETLVLNTKHRVIASIPKWKGTNAKPPPSLPTDISLFNGIGAFLILLLLSGISQYIENRTNGRESIVLGPFGALLTLLMNLTAAPATQPLAIMLSEVVALVVAKSLCFFPTSLLSIWVRRALAPGITIGLTAIFGIIHPPAGAVALIVSSSNSSLSQCVIILASNAIAIFVSILYINLSFSKQYPVYWGIKTPFP